MFDAQTGRMLIAVVQARKPIGQPYPDGGPDKEISCVRLGSLDGRRAPMHGPLQIGETWRTRAPEGMCSAALTRYVVGTC